MQHMSYIHLHQRFTANDESQHTEQSLRIGTICSMLRPGQRWLWFWNVPALALAQFLTDTFLREGYSLHPRSGGEENREGPQKRQNENGTSLGQRGPQASIGRHAGIGLQLYLTSNSEFARLAVGWNEASCTIEPKKGSLQARRAVPNNQTWTPSSRSHADLKSWFHQSTEATPHRLAESLRNSKPP